MAKTGVIYGINGPVVSLAGDPGFQMNEMVYVGKENLVGEVIGLTSEKTTIQVYEETSGLKPGEVVTGTGAPVSVTLAPGILDNIFDGIERPLSKIAERSGYYISRGISVDSLDTSKKWKTHMTVKKGDRVLPGTIIAEVPETRAIVHKVMVPPDTEGYVLDVVKDGEYTINEPLLTLQLLDGTEKKLTMTQKWPIRGEDIAAGAPIAAAGTVLTPAHIGVLAGQGIPDAEVFRPLTVGVLATGSELLEAGEAWAPGKIYDANGIQNAARLRQLGFAVERTHCSDDPEEIAARMQDLLTRCDAVITSGGVSVGQKDYLPTVLEMLHAEPVFAGVAQKPGSPMIAAQVGEKLVFCLSGNPFAAAATLEQYAVPALLRAAGRREEDCIPVHTRGRLTTGFSKPSKGTRFLRARALGGLVEIPGEGNAEAHSSGSLSAMMGCNCLVELPAGSGPVAPGEEVEVLNFVQ